MEIPTMNQALIAALGVALLALGASGIAWSDRDHGRADPDRANLGAPTNARYQSECGGCHLAYPPGLLPAADWNQVMDTLAEHFGDDASLDPAVAAEIRSYLRANAADRGLRTRPGKATSTPGNQGPRRITQTRYFLRKHDEVPTRLVSGNPEIGSFSNCQACHVGAAKGDFDEEDVRIPGVGRWED
jgi:mono/diheme cytochrome c family protein